MSVLQPPVITPSAAWEKAGRRCLNAPPQILVYHQTHDVAYYQQVSKMGWALLQIRRVVVVEVGRRSAPGKAGLGVDPKSLFSAAPETGERQKANEASKAKRTHEA
jgi:hypothetical protein